MKKILPNQKRKEVENEKSNRKMKNQIQKEKIISPNKKDENDERKRYGSYGWPGRPGPWSSDFLSENLTDLFLGKGS